MLRSKHYLILVFGVLICIYVLASGCFGQSESTPVPNIDTPTPPATDASTQNPTAIPTPVPTYEPLTDREMRQIGRWQNEGWKTDFEKRTIQYDSVLSGGVCRDCIPPIDKPIFVKVSVGLEYIDDLDPVVVVEHECEAKAYPLHTLTRHEIVNDTVCNKPVAVTFCPLCNSAIAFDRIVGGELLSFGVSGKLRNSDLIMYDRNTHSWWQQFTGEALAGEYVKQPNTLLDIVPSYITTWHNFKEKHPDGLALDRDPSYPASSYQRDFYAGYDSSGAFPFLFSGEVDRRLDPTERVLAIEIDGERVAYSFSYLNENPVVNAQLGSKEYVIFFDNMTFSAFKDTSFNKHQTGSATAFLSKLGDKTLKFSSTESGITDDKTGSIWSVTGQAVSGELSGQTLKPVVHGNHFWFAWYAFAPEVDLVALES